jgi:hypothetical protein
MSAQPEVKEESITDSYLYRLSQAVPTIGYKSFSRWDEARRTGADWEWWFLLPGRALRLRAQAKKLRVGRSIRADLMRRNKHGSQMAMLIKAARRDRAIPVYVLYSESALAKTSCGPGSAPVGVYVATAGAVKALVSSRPALRDADVLAISRAAACLPCCLLHRAQVDIKRNIAAWEAEFAAEQSDLFPDGYGWHAEIPSYVRELFPSLKGVTVAPSIPEGGAPDDIQAVMAVDLTHSG